MTRDINESPFDEATKLKLAIFQESFKEWLPVFINAPFTKQVYIFDFFAGSGKDSIGNNGSPLILLDTAKGVDKKYCNTIDKPIHFIFNEAIESKYLELKYNIEEHIYICSAKNNCNNCVYNYQILKYEFQEIFRDEKIQSILANKSIGKFILLDQYGFKEINEKVFSKLIKYPKTDFIFFISSSFIKRFKEHPYTKKYINTEKISFDDVKPNECHRIIAEYFRQLIPKDQEYYIHNFTIQKEFNKGNFYGLIFGSNHTLGMEKFIKTCWGFDPLSGEANFNIDDNFESNTLFYNPDTTNKKEIVRQKIRYKILSGEIQDNIKGLKFALKNGCQPKLFTEVVRSLEEQDKITRNGDLNFSSTNIHKVKKYYIKLA